MTLASTVVESRVFKWSNIAFQYTRYFTDQPRPSVFISIDQALLVSMTLASTVVESRVFKGSNISFQCMRSLTDQPRPSKLSNCLCLNRLNITSKYDFGFHGC